MNIIQKEPYENGSFPPIQNWNDKYEIPDGYAVVPDDFSTSVFYANNCFVLLTIENIDGVDTVTDMLPNVEVREKWRTENPETAEPEPEPTQLDRIEAQVTYTAMMTDTLLEV